MKEINVTIKTPTKKMTKDQLLELIDDLNKQIDELDKELEARKRYEKYEEAAGEVKAMKDAFVNSGFTESQAFEMTMKMFDMVLRTGAIFKS